MRHRVVFQSLHAWLWLTLIGLAGVLPGCAAPPPAGPTDEALVVRPRPVAFHFLAEGTLDWREQSEIIHAPGAYEGRTRVEAILVPSGPVEAGQPLLKLSAESIDKAVADAERAVVNARQRVSVAQTQVALAARWQNTIIAEHELARAKAQQALETWKQIKRSDAIRRSDLALQRRQHAHLEKYARIVRDAAATQTAAQPVTQPPDASASQPASQPISLDNLDLSEAVLSQLKLDRTELDLARHDHELLVRVDIPQRDRALEVARQRATVALEQAQQQRDSSLDLAGTALINAEVDLERARRQLQQLEADREALTVTAPAAGLFEGQVLEAGQAIEPGERLGRLLEPDRPIVALRVDAAQAMLLEPGDTVTIQWPALDAADTRGAVAGIDAPRASADQADETRIVIDLAEIPAAAVLGDRVAVIAVNQIPGTLSLPTRWVAAAVDRRGICLVETDRGFERRAVLLGAGDAQRTAIVAGLQSGDRVLPITRPRMRAR